MPLETKLAADQAQDGVRWVGRAVAGDHEPWESNAGLDLPLGEGLAGAGADPPWVVVPSLTVCRLPCAVPWQPCR